MIDIANLRLQNQHLTGNDFQTPQDVVRHLGAVQAQEYESAKWSVGLRMRHATNEMVEEAFNQGKFLRTHVMRPTWHFVMPEDIRWMLELTAPRVKALMGHYNRKLDLTDKLLARTQKIIVKALKEREFLTRQELRDRLVKEKITAAGQRLGHIVMWAELDGIICSGPKIGKQLTYALFEKRVRASKKLNHDQALKKLSTTYFQSHGPAQVKDFAWWSGLTMADARNSLDMIKSKLSSETKDGKTYWFKDGKTTTRKISRLFLLSIYDEYTIAYKDRTDLSRINYIERMIAKGNALTSVIILDGKVIGTWKRKLMKNKVEIKPDLFEKVRGIQDLLESEVSRYGDFWGMPAVLK